MKRIIAFVLVIASLCSLFSGCGKKEEEAYVPTGDALVMEGDDPNDYILKEEKIQELTLAYESTRSMNPLVGISITNRVLMSLIYQGLFAVDSKNNPTPILCSQWQTSADNMIYTFYLEENARFSDGSRVTVEDVLATYEAAKNDGYYKGRFTHVARITPTEDGTGVQFFLNFPYESLPMILDVPIVKASEVEADFPLGTGPYIFSESIGGIYLIKNPEWWVNKEIEAKRLHQVKVPATADAIPLVEVTDQPQIRDEFQFGDVGLAIANPMADSYAEYRCDYELWDVDSGMFLYLGVNVTYSDYFKDDAALRHALTYAIDRQGLIDKNYRGLAYPATLAASPGSPYYIESMAAKYDYDPMKFLDALGGWAPPKKKDKDEEGERKMILLVNSDDSARLKTARAIAKNLTELGVPCGTMEYGNSTNPTYETVLRANNWDLYLGQTKLSPNYDLTEFFRGWGELSWGAIDNKDVYGLVQDALENSGSYYNLLKDVAERSYIVPVLFGYYTVYAERGLFENLSPARDNVFYYTLGKTMKDTQIATVYD